MKKKRKLKRDKELVRAAQWLRRAFEKRKAGAIEQIKELWPGLHQSWSELCPEQQTLEAAKTKPTREGMRETQRLLRQVRGRVNSLQSCAHHIIQRIDSCSAGLMEQEDGRITSVGLPSLSDCYKQVEALAREFGSYELDTERRTIITPSHEVKLGNVLFGRYNIIISLNDIAANDRSFYHVEPVSSECPRIDNSTHPHLNNGRLCEGDGDGALTKAFDDGRLYDCVLLINNILQTYGNGPYVDLERFERVVNGGSEYEYNCEDCSCGLNEEDVFRCEQCNEDRCRDCITQCQASGIWICEQCKNDARATGTACLDICEGIGDNVCFVRQNMPCPSCGQILPDSRLAKCDIVQDEAQLCITCAQSWAKARESCDSCLMHGYLGCALVKYGYPLLDTLNHPANVTARGQQHMHHDFGWHSVSLLHKDQKNGDAQSDFRAYRNHLNQRGGSDYSRRNNPTVTHQQRAALVEIEV